MGHSIEPVFRKSNVGRVLNKIATRAATPISCTQLVVFRIGFGLLCAAEILMEWSARKSWVEDRPIHFPHLGFEWLGLLPEGWGVPFLCAQLVFCLGIATGCCYRASSSFFALAYAWMLLVDRPYFNNHFYLIVLLSAWFAICNANCHLAIDAWVNPRRRTTCLPAWQLYGIIAQLGIVYFFGGLAKVNQDWLRGEPMHFFLMGAADHPILHVLANNKSLSVAMAWGGMLFDLTIIPILLWRRTRLAGFAAMILFHVLNANLFSIGIFPYLSLGTLVLFVPTKQLSRAVTLMARQAVHTQSKQGIGGSEATRAVLSRSVAALLIVWFGLQVTVPLRRFVLPGNVGWTREGYYFAWTMMLDVKAAYLGLHLCDPETGACRPINYAKDLNWVQRRWLPGEPRGIAEYARFIAAREGEGMKRLAVVCDAVASLNGRPYQFMIDPAVDPSRARLPTLRHADWIVPVDRDAPIGHYLSEDSQEAIIAPMLHKVRVEQRIFPWLKAF